MTNRFSRIENECEYDGVCYSAKGKKITFGGITEDVSNSKRASRIRHSEIGMGARSLQSRGTRVVKGAGMRSQCVVLRRFKSCPLHHLYDTNDYGAV